MSKRASGLKWMAGLWLVAACAGSAGTTQMPVEGSAGRGPDAVSGSVAAPTTTGGRASAAPGGSSAVASGAGAGAKATTGGTPAVAAASGGAGAGAGAAASATAGASSATGGSVAAAGSGGAGASATAGAAGAAPAAGGSLPAVMTTAAAGPFKTMQDLASGPKGKSGLFRPATLGENGVKHPVFVWGCGGGSNPTSYAELLTQIASHGFVVIAEVENIGDNGAPLLAAADWLVSENGKDGSAMYQKLDTSKLGLGGHSIGSVNSFIAGTDPRWTTTIHVAGGSLDNVNDPNAATTGKGGKSLIHPTAYICSESDVFGNVEKTQKDYDNTTVPVYFTIIKGADHTGAARAGMPALIAWLRWHLGGEVERKSSFLDPMGEFCSGKYMSRSKNW